MTRPAAAVALACCFAPSSFPHSPVQAEPIAAADLPLIDFHEHLLSQRSAEELTFLIEEAGISRMVLMPVGVGPNLGTSGYFTLRCWDRNRENFLSGPTADVFCADHLSSLSSESIMCSACEP